MNPVEKNIEESDFKKSEFEKKEFEKSEFKKSEFEIERKYLVKKIPAELANYKCKKISQGYLCTSPVVRIRRSDEEYYLTYKGSGLMIRKEYNLPLTKESYEHLKEKIDGRLIEKTRYLIPLDNGLTAELDIFEGDLAPLCLVEVEFKSVDDANLFIAPDWFGTDVTQSGKYHNSYLSRFENS